MENETRIMRGGVARRPVALTAMTPPARPRGGAGFGGDMGPESSPERPAAVYPRQRPLPARGAGLALAVLLVASVAGCASTRDPEAAAKASGLITFKELDQMNKAFADRFVLLVTSACDDIEHDNPSLHQRRKAHELKLYSATSAFDIASNLDPYIGLLDLTLSVTLVSHVWIDEDRAEETFGPERARVLIDTLRRARVEVWDLAAKAVKPENLEKLDYLIWEWRRANPAVEHVEFVRFNDFAELRGKFRIADVRSGGLLAPVGEAKKAVDDARLFAERAFYLGKRAPLMFSWQAEALNYELLTTPELSRALNNFDNFSTSLNRLNLAIDRLPRDVATERQAIIAAIDQREKMINSVVASVRATITDLDKLLVNVKEVVAGSERLAVALRSTSDSLTGTIHAADTAAARYVPTPPGAGGATPAASRLAKGADTVVPTTSRREVTGADAVSPTTSRREVTSADTARLANM